MNDYEWLTQMGLCHRCRKKKLAPGKKFCLDCLEIIRDESRRRYNPEYYKGYRLRRREIYREKKEAGICVRCSKPATHGMYCYEHYIHEKRRSQLRAQEIKEKRHETGLVSDERKERGLCLWCGEKAVKGLACCKKHRQIFSEAGKRNKGHRVEMRF